MTPFAFLAFCIAALACAIAAMVVLRARATARCDRRETAAALAVSAMWAAAVAAEGSDHPVARALEIVRNLAWIYALFRHFANDGRDERLAPVRPVALTLGLVEGFQLLMLTLVPEGMALGVSALLRMLVAVGALVMVHNLYASAAGPTRRMLAWSSGGLALFWAFELNLFTVSYLTDHAAGGASVARAGVLAVLAAATAMGAHAMGGMSFRPSRAVTFSGLSLAVLGGYFLTMIALAKGVALVAGDLARITQVAFLLLAALATLVFLPSPRLRATARVLALKHLFRHRYDYREEWLRFTRTIALSADGDDSLPERAIQSLADMADSPAGLLFTPQDDGGLELAAQWRWPTQDRPCGTLPAALADRLERSGAIVDLDGIRTGRDHRGEGVLIPAWLRGDQRAWAGVPLLHGERLVGFIVLARPVLPRDLDWEDFDLLKVAEPPVASYLAERSSQQALADAERFDQFNRRMAFVLHDIKNLSSQLALLARNAERHAENPAFRADMLVTLRNSADKLAALVQRLGRYGRAPAEGLAPLDLVTIARQLSARFAAIHPVEVISATPATVLAAAEPLEQALAHLVQNAVDASPAGSPVRLSVERNGGSGAITVADKGPGMSARFVQNDLFRPFVSTREYGFGIGACEARDLVRGMGGQLLVDSREGEGTRFTVSLPLAGQCRQELPLPPVTTPARAAA